MKTTVSTVTGIIVFAGLICFSSEVVFAQTARDVRCRGCVGATDLANRAVITNKIKDNAVSGQKIQDGAVTEQKLQNASVSAAKLASDAQPAGADYTTNGVSTGLDPIPSTKSSAVDVELTLPGPGHVLVNASGYILFDSTGVEIVCHIVRNGETLSAPRIRIQGTNAGDADRMPIAGTRAFAESAAATVVYSLVCGATSGTAALFDAEINAIFVPKQY